MIVCYICLKPFVAQGRQDRAERPTCSRECRLASMRERNAERKRTARQKEARKSKVAPLPRQPVSLNAILDDGRWSAVYKCHRVGCTCMKPVVGLCYCCAMKRPRTIFRPDERLAMAA